MKLVNRYSRVHIISAFVMMLISCVAYYFIIQTILLHQIDRDLKVEEEEILDYIRLNKRLPMASDYKYQQIKFEVATGKIEKQLVNTRERSARDGKYEPYRRLSFPVTVNNTTYKAIVYKSKVETEYLLRLIVGSTGLLFLLLFVIIFLVNRFVLEKVWQPFFHTLKELKNFGLHSEQSLTLPDSRVEEFHELNRSVSQMAKRVTTEFENLKRFTENASHEMQTPLAIIRSKLDLLIQSSNASQSEPLQSIYNAAERLTRLNQTLLLLTKIGNNQYREAGAISIKELVEAKFQQFEELIKAKGLLVDLDLQEFKATINKGLADILLNNLLSNAIKHNVENGMIDCKLFANELVISNTGPELSFDKNQIFNRFHKSNESKGTGLGLSVVKEICDAFNIKIEYSFENVHTIRLVFRAISSN